MMMGRTAPTYLLLFLIGSSFLANVLAHSNGKQKVQEDSKHKDHKEDKKDHEQHKDHHKEDKKDHEQHKDHHKEDKKDHEQHKDHHKEDKKDHEQHKDHHKDEKDHEHHKEYKHDDDHEQQGHQKEEKKWKEEDREEFLEFLRKFKEQVLEECKKEKSDSGKKNKHSHGDRDDDIEGKDNHKPATYVHHYHHYPDESIKTYSTHNKDCSNHQNYRIDYGNKESGNHHYHDHAGSHEFHGESQPYDQNTRDCRHDDALHGHKEPRPYYNEHDYGNSNDRHIPNSPGVGEGNQDKIHHQPHDTDNSDSYTHGSYTNEQRNTRYHGYDQSHSRRDRHSSDGGASSDISAEPISDSTHCGHREDSSSRQSHNHDSGVRSDQYNQNYQTYDSDVTYALSENSVHQQERVPDRESNIYEPYIYTPSNTHQQPKPSQVAHVCHHHEHVFRVAEPTLLNQHQCVEASNTYSHLPTLQLLPSYPEDTTATLNVPAPFCSVCTGSEEPQPTAFCHEQRLPQHPSDKPKKSEPVYMICVDQKTLETQCERPTVNPLQFPPPRREPPNPSLQRDPCFKSRVHQPQQHNVGSKPR